VRALHYEKSREIIKKGENSVGVLSPQAGLLLFPEELSKELALTISSDTRQRKGSEAGGVPEGVKKGG